MVIAAPMVTCARHVEGATPAYPASAAKRLLQIPGVLRLGVTRGAYVPGLGSRTAGGFVYKIGAIVNAGNAGRTVGLTVVEPTVLLTYPGVRGRSIALRACPPNHPRWRDGLPIGAWTAYPGGFLVSEATCVHLIVRSGSRTYRLALDLGVRCS